MPKYIPFKEKYDEEIRTAESLRIITKYQDRIPIIVEKCSNCNLPHIEKHKFLVSKDLTLGQFVYIIRKRIELNPEQALFIMINHSLAPNNKTISELYDTHKDKDNFLYITYTSENTFG